MTEKTVPDFQPDYIHALNLARELAKVGIIVSPDKCMTALQTALGEPRGTVQGHGRCDHIGPHSPLGCIKQPGHDGSHRVNLRW